MADALHTQVWRFTTDHWRAAVRHLMWRVVGGAVIPILLLWALVCWKDETGPNPGFLQLVARGELYLVAVGLFIGSLQDTFVVRRAAQRFSMEMLTFTLFAAALFCILAWATLVDSTLAPGSNMADSKERLATTWGMVASSVGAGIGTVTALLADDGR